MTKSTINENAIHEQIVNIEIKIISLKKSLQEICKYFAIDELYQDTVTMIEGISAKLDRIKLQLGYIDDMIHHAKLQRESKPLIIKKGE
jgi:hypothetical protein